MLKSSDHANNAKAFRAWLRGAMPGDRCIYHIGQIASDRITTRDLDELADVVLMFVDLGVVTHMAQRLPLAGGVQTIYSATRSKGPPGPRALRDGSIKPLEFRALRAVADRDVNSRQSATRAMRDMAGIPEGRGKILLETLKFRGLLEFDVVAGWSLTATGHAILR